LAFDKPEEGKMLDERRSGVPVCAQNM